MWTDGLANLTRRHFLESSGYGLGLAALSSMMELEGRAGDASTNLLAPKPSHAAPKAKNCIFIFLEGAPSQLDLFDPKP